MLATWVVPANAYHPCGVGFGESIYEVREGAGGVTVSVVTPGVNYYNACTDGSVDYETFPIEAAPGEDYEPQSGTLTFTPGGPLIQELRIRLLDDSEGEADERFGIRLFNADEGVGHVGESTVVRVSDDDTTFPPDQAGAEDRQVDPQGEHGSDGQADRAEAGAQVQSDGEGSASSELSGRRENSTVADRAPTVQGVDVVEDPDGLASAEPRGSTSGWAAALIAGGLLGGLALVGAASRRRVRRP